MNKDMNRRRGGEDRRERKEGKRRILPEIVTE